MAMSTTYAEKLRGDGKVPSDLNAAMASLLEPEEKESALGASDPFSDEKLLALWKKMKPECFDDRWIFERQWTRNIYYVLGRQWIEYHSPDGVWRDKRLARWVPRPVTNKCKETVQSLRAMFATIRLSANCRPNGTDPKNVAVASTADELEPLLYENHKMTDVMNEGDFWFLVTGNTFTYTFIDYDMKNGVIENPVEQCQQCGEQTTSDKIAEAGNACPKCGGTQFAPALGEDGQPMVNKQPKPKAVTLPLSPLELAFPNSFARFDELPYVVRMRWRPKTYYEQHPSLSKSLFPHMTWQKEPEQRTMQIYKSLAMHNDLGINPIHWSEGVSGQTSSDGVVEYEISMKPTDEYPKGLVFRIVGDAKPLVVRMDEEALPGPLPYTDNEGTPLFTYGHAAFEHVGGRILGSGPIDVIIQKQDQLNQLDSQFLMIIQRMASPGWSVPKGAGVVKFTGAPGFIMEWNPLTVGGNAEPKQFPGIGPDTSLFQYREQILKDIEELAGTFDIMKGAKPSGVEAFSALQLLHERSQGRFASAFKARGDLYKNWFKFALELERAFGPDEMTKWVLSPTRTWTAQTFKSAQLQGNVTVVVEDGSTTPKTTLGLRASFQQAAELGIVDVKDPDTQYEALKAFGLQKMVPALDYHIQAALLKQQAFEEFIANPQAVEAAIQQDQQEQAKFAETASAAAAAGVDPAMAGLAPKSPLSFTPLVWRKWYDPMIHRREFLKWANSDRVRQMLSEQPAVAGFLEGHLMEIDLAMAEQMMGPFGGGLPAEAMLAGRVPTPGGAAMSNSNRENSRPGGPGGSRERPEGQGPA